MVFGIWHSFDNFTASQISVSTRFWMHGNFFSATRDNWKYIIEYKTWFWVAKIWTTIYSDMADSARYLAASPPYWIDHSLFTWNYLNFTYFLIHLETKLIVAPIQINFVVFSGLQVQVQVSCESGNRNLTRVIVSDFIIYLYTIPVHWP